MKKNYIFCVLFVCLLCLGNTYPNFADYCLQFGKGYSLEESARREPIYNARIAGFANATSYTPAVNYMTDWTQAEIEAKKGLQISSTKNEEKKYVSSKIGAPSSLDWRDKNAVTSVKNQGSCGSCWAFAAAAYAQSKLIIQGKYKADDINLSQQFILKCTEQSNCEGGYLEQALKTVQVCPLDQKYPYNPIQEINGICSASGIRTGYIGQNYYKLSDSELINLLQKGPVAISISSVGWERYGSGVFSCSSSDKVDHAVLLIGYTPDYWIIKNQWGVSWGLSGYIHISRTSGSNCGVGQSAHILFGHHYELAIGVMLVLLGLLL